MTCSDYIQEGKLVPDDLIFSLLKARQDRADCRIHGFVLESFPKSLSQIRLLDDLKLDPSMIVTLELSSNFSLQRYDCKMLDPVTGFKYRKEELDSLPKEVRERVGEIPMQSKETLEQRNERWNPFYETLKERFPDKICPIDASLSIENVIEKISFSLEKAIK